ncbi:hypothetical protein [Haloechinothrix salitolerans]|uniref:Superoxide dismutase, Cu-Zn family n=1 Tax=Haloechinothrix salitolerans TaxID=926830 RepID=A0ABW2C8I6_9PSEU
MRYIDPGKTAVVAAVLALTLAACGDDTGQASEETTPATTSAADGHDHGDDMEHGSAMQGDPNATPANEIDGAEVVEGSFAKLSSAPEDAPLAEGTVWLARHDEGTTVTIDVTGLEPETEYMSHLHANACASDDGGPHFKFDPQGSDQPPNEVHLVFTTDAEGAVTTTISNDNPDSQGVKSIVLHLNDADGTKFACADL